MIRVVGYLERKRFRGTQGAGLLTGIPLGLTGCVSPYRLVSLLLFT